MTPPPSVPPVAPAEELAEPSVVSVARLTLSATVDSITGSSAVAAGASCSFEVAFTTFSNNNTECHTDIVCGDNVHLYGGTESGFFRCQFSASPARVVGEDVSTTAADQDAAMVIDTDRRVLELRDDAGGVAGALELHATITSL